jgi:CO/xanthine dehydrogenase Mo-binding subunit
MTNYIVPTSLDTPNLHVSVMQNPTRYSPLGAKGVGEMPMDGPAAAVAHAVQMATGLPIEKIPTTPHALHALSIK